MTLLLLILGMLVLLAIRVPVAHAMLLPCLLYTLFSADITLGVAIQRVVAGINSFPLLAVPLFIMTGYLANAAGFADRLFRLLARLLKGLPGRLAYVNVGSSVMFSWMSGAAIADAAGLGAVLVPAMRKEGYDEGFSLGLTGASSMIGPLMPPSIPAIIYAVTAGVSVGGLFFAGVVPAVMLAAMLCLHVFLHTRRHPPRESSGPFVADNSHTADNTDGTDNTDTEDNRETGGDTAAGDDGDIAGHAKQGVVRAERATDGRPGVAREILSTAPILFTPVIILGGILGGVFTPTEAAAAAVMYLLFLGACYRTLHRSMLWQVLLRTSATTGAILLIVASASLFGWIVAREQGPQLVAETLSGQIERPMAFLLTINLFLLVVGMLLEPTAALLICVPVLLPVATQFGVDPLHLGVVMILNLVIGLITPPVGLVLYVLSSVTGADSRAVMRGIVPFLIPLLVTLVAVSLIPELSLWLPRRLGL